MGKIHLPGDLRKELDRLAKEMASTRSQTIRTVMNEGITSVRLQRALDQYQAGETSLEGGADYARVSLHRFAQAATQRGIPYFRNTVDEAEVDRQTAKNWFQ